MRLPTGLCVLVLAVMTVAVHAEDKAATVSRVLPEGQLPDDARLGEPRSLRDKYHPWTPPESLAEWEREADTIRRQVMVATGMWPMPSRPKPSATIHGKLDRGDYTVEKVFLPSAPGHYVTGNLYRPKNIQGKAPAVLSPHGHWQDARFYDAGEEPAKKLIAGGGETYLSAARHHVQARMVGLARMGCVVFHYDMVGYSDSKQIGHTAGFTDVEALLRLQNFMGLQTYNSLCALDFLSSLPDVDPARIGVTGASGGGTQTFILCAIDHRPAAAFPAVMASTGMQGGCICENATFLRLGINNIAITALFAPKPLALTGANDWTIEIEAKGLPELKQVYSLYGKPENVTANAFPQFGHNYNQVSRELMYAWFNEHLQVGHETPIREEDFNPYSREELSVFDDSHPLPAAATGVEELRKSLTQDQQKLLQSLLPSTKKEAEKYREVIGTAAAVMLDRGVPKVVELERKDLESKQADGFTIQRSIVGRKGAREQVPLIVLTSPQFDGRCVLWVHPDGKSGLFDANGKPKPSVQKLLDGGYGVVGADLFLTGEFVAAGEEPKYPEVNKSYAGYTLGYNRSVLANRVRDILTVIGVLVEDERVKTIDMIATGAAGPWGLLARALADDAVVKTIADARGFSFGNVNSLDDPMLLPGALKYGGLGGLTALAAPHQLTLAGTKGIPQTELQTLNRMYQATGGKLAQLSGTLTMKRAADELLK